MKIYNTTFNKYIALSLSILTIITFSIAIATPPISGFFCQSNCIDYPYLNITSRFPRDYIWMFPAIVLTMIYMIWTYSIQNITEDSRKLFSRIAVGFAVSASLILILNYFVQITVIQASLLNNEIHGIPLWTQYNENGLFIAFEEIGYIFMSIGFLFTAFALAKDNKKEKRIRWILISSFILTIASLFFVSITRGHQKGYLFEIIVISIDWLTLIVIGFMSMNLYKK